MSNILFAWEFGENWGHLSRDLPVAQRLRAAGHQVLFAVYDSNIALDILRPAGIPYVQAPLSRRIAHPTQPLANHAEMLISQGYAERATLSGLIGGWHGLFDVFQPEVVVIDYAPTASLAAKIRGIPTVLVGSGFELPPGTCPLPAFRPWEKLPRERLLLAEELVLRTINGVLRDFAVEPLKQFADLFDGRHNILTTFAELDHFGERSGQIYTGPIYELPKARSVQWASDHEGPRIFAYLRSGIPEVEALLQALHDSEAHVICAFPDAAESLIRRFQTPVMQIFPAAVSLKELLPSASLVIGYGNGTIATSLLAGVPLLLTPYMIEQFLGAFRVEALGAGLMVKGKCTRESYSIAIKTLLSESRFREAARRFANKYHDFDSGRAVDFIAATVLGLLKQ